MSVDLNKIHRFDCAICDAPRGVNDEAIVNEYRICLLRFEPGHRQASFRADSQPSNGMFNGDTGRKTQSIEASMMYPNIGRKLCYSWRD